MIETRITHAPLNAEVAEAGVISELHDANWSPLISVTELDVAEVELIKLELVTPTSNATYNSNCDGDFT